MANVVISGNIGAVPPNTNRPLHVASPNVNENVVVGDNSNRSVFFEKDHGSNLVSYKLRGSAFFIGFDQASKILKLVSNEMKWEARPLDDDTESEVFTIINNVKNFWEMDPDAVGSVIKLSTDLSTSRPPKQKWKFVRSRT